MTEFTTKDSGERQQWSSGMQRDVQTGKPRFALIWTKRQPYDEQMLTRYARLLARGAEKYEDRNWEEGCGQEELDYAQESLLRHTTQLIAGETDEDHAAAVWFNTQLIEYLRWRMAQKSKRKGSAKRRRRKRERAAMLERQAEQAKKSAKFKERGRALAEEMFGDDDTYDAMRQARKAADTTGAKRVEGELGLFQFADPSAFLLSPQAQERINQTIRNLANIYQAPTYMLPALPTYAKMRLTPKQAEEYFPNDVTTGRPVFHSIQCMATVGECIPSCPRAIAKQQPTIEESLQMGLDRDQRNH